MIGSIEMGHLTKSGEELTMGEEQGKQGKGENELRRSPRLSCEGLAGVQTLPAFEKPCPAKIINLSVGGCLMEFERPLTLEMDEIVELMFCVKRMPFRVRGKVRAIRSATLVGFQFPHVSDRARRQLEDLVGELIGHLTKLHLKSISNRLDPDHGTRSRLPASLARGEIGLFRAAKPGDAPLGNVVSSSETHRRWW